MEMEKGIPVCRTGVLGVVLADMRMRWVFSIGPLERRGELKHRVETGSNLADNGCDSSGV
jgi:hypothetical protein